MRPQFLFLLFPVLGVVGMTPLKAHKFNPRAKALAEAHKNFAPVQARADAVKIIPHNKAPVDANPFLPRVEDPLEAQPLLKRESSTSEPGQDGAVKRFTNLQAGWRYYDCFADINGKTLQSFTVDAIDFTSAYYENGNAGPTGVSVTTCIDYCSSRGYLYADLGYYYQCQCGYRIQPGNTPALGCTGKCYALQKETRGGDNRMQVYVNDAGPIYGPKVPATLPNNFAYINCYNTGMIASQALPASISTTSATNTGASSVSYCNAAGYAYAGTMNQQCYFSANLLSSATTAMRIAMSRRQDGGLWWNAENVGLSAAGHGAGFGECYLRWLMYAC
ncbi:hypothetical protein K458DRAFT_402588 [Lentithecium fluviatile CBS 122367]|uniref:WSC domain-containing protein n=1 Tax=Lentithecium fluviatile CBS 122367 TaxID=1168545 RepID=A0A6G1J6L5_9PLEO|nr:hypothetical protein K458DRAFT_402588 [Lentithecium fluviatile CBS 122367]